MAHRSYYPHCFKRDKFSAKIIQNWERKRVDSGYEVKVCSLYLLRKLYYFYITVANM